MTTRFEPYVKYTGREFVHGIMDCYTLVRDFFKGEFNINMTNYARPEEWWHHEQSLYNDFFRNEGFEIIELPETEWQKGDLILMAIGSSVPCHAGIYLGDNFMLHHFINRRSNIELYKGMWKNFTLSVIRNKTVVIPKQVVKMELKDDPRIKDFLLAQQHRQGKRGFDIPKEGNN